MGLIKVAVLVVLLSIVIAVLLGRDELLGYLLPPCMIRQFGKYFSNKPSQTSTSPSESLSGSANFLPLTVPENRAKIYTKDELSAYDGSEGSPGLLLAIVGQVFDVSKGKRHYGPGGGYSFFSAKDGTRGFITGDFTEEGLIDDLDEITSAQASEVKDWVDFYHKDYTYVGVVEGAFFDSAGAPKSALMDVVKLVKNAQTEKDGRDAEDRRFPSCNSQWSKEEGTILWCTDNSGGIKRNWKGVPRIYHSAGSTSTRCACVRTSGAPSEGKDDKKNKGDLDNPRLKPYKGCSVTSDTCKLIK